MTSTSFANVGTTVSAAVGNSVTCLASPHSLYTCTMTAIATDPATNISSCTLTLLFAATSLATQGAPSSDNVHPYKPLLPLAVLVLIYCLVSHTRVLFVHDKIPLNAAAPVLGVSGVTYGCTTSDIRGGVDCQTPAR